MTNPWAFMVAQWERNCLQMQEMWVRSLDGEDPLEKGMVNHSSIFACEVTWTEELGSYSPRGSKRVGHNLVTN